MSTSQVSHPVEARQRRVTSSHAVGWQGLTMRDLRRFVEESGDIPDETCLIAVTPGGTAALRGIGFFSMG